MTFDTAPFIRLDALQSLGASASGASLATSTGDILEVSCYGPGVFRRVFGDWLAQQAAAGRVSVPDPSQAADQFIGLLRGGLDLRATLGLTPPTEPELDAAVSSAVAAFVRAYAPPA